MKRKNTRDLIVTGFACLVFVGMTGLFILDIIPTILNEQQDFPLKPIDINPKWGNVSEYKNTERPIPWLVVNRNEPEIAISYEELECLYDQGHIINVKYVIEKDHIKFYGREEIIGKNGSYFELRTVILRPESNPIGFEITGNYIEKESIIFIETDKNIRFSKKMAVVFCIGFSALSLYTFALFLRILFDKNYKHTNEID